MIQAALAKLVEKQSLTMEEAEEAMGEIMEGQATPAQIAGFLVALRLKGETEEEMAGFVTVMRAHAVPVEGPEGVVLVDTCGTGGDGRHTFNISTAAACVAAGAGAYVAKHGNRAMSGRCGSADVLEALGVNIQLGPQDVARTLAETRLGFMFAPKYHPAMRHAGPVRAELRVRTVFNLLGPLTNPAGARAQVLGVADPRAALIIARALAKLGTRHALVVHGDSGLDEIALSGPTICYEIRDGQEPRRFTITPEEFGLKSAPIAAIKGGPPPESAEVVQRILDGEPGPPRDVVLLNSAAALYVGGQVASLEDGVALAAETIDSHAAAAALDRFIAASNNRPAPADTPAPVPA
ncbi:MAG TPA: anthranilate phosphoribosyltransferase [Chloroflexia bacterium]|jgi:anthranilate phosphoribosyltransferase|nr:anthranilate phosphoribosyltransferase [Chloroflexia bacterium]